MTHIDDYRDYLGRLLPDAGLVGIFDVGRIGSLQSALSTILKRKFQGFYVAVGKEIQANVDPYDYETYLSESHESIDSHGQSTVLHEVLLSSPDPSVGGVEGDGQSGFDTLAERDVETSGAVKEIQSGALDFVEDIYELFGSDIHKLRLGSAEGNLVLSRFMTLGTELDKSIAADLLHEGSVTIQTPRPLHSYYKAEVSQRLGPKVYTRGDKGGRRNKGVFKSNTPNPKIANRILIYCPAMTRLRGGAERITKYLVDYLVDAGYEVEVLTSGRLNIRRPAPVFSLPSTVSVIHVDPRSRTNIEKAIVSFRPNILMVLASGDFLGAFVKAAHQRNVPIVLSECVEPKSSHKTYWPSASWRRYVATYASADSIHVQLPTFADQFPTRLQKRIHVIANPVLLPESLPPLEKREDLIVCVARISLRQKGQDHLIRAFSRVSHRFANWRVELYGDIREEDFGPVVSLIRDLGLEDRILLKGRVSNVESILHRASIFAFPSHYEGFPNALAEAMAQGLPAVGHRECPGVRDLIDPGKTGLLVETNGDGRFFGDALELLMENAHLRGELGERAFWAIRQYGGDQTFREWERLIESTCARHGANDFKGFRRFWFRTLYGKIPK